LVRCRNLAFAIIWNHKYLDFNISPQHYVLIQIKSL
ncbi:hypothetical protein RCH19_000726, partial [Flavobacterium sp. PL12]